MKTFRVVWEIDIEADSAAGAAMEALEIQRDPDSTATFFKVYDNSRNDVGIVAPGFEVIEL
jgi:hypothetical protein